MHTWKAVNSSEWEGGFTAVDTPKDYVPRDTTCTHSRAVLLHICLHTMEHTMEQYGVLLWGTIVCGLVSYC